MKRWMVAVLLLALAASLGCAAPPAIPVATDPVPAPASPRTVAESPPAVSPAPPAPLTDADRKELAELGLRVWEMAAHSDATGLLAMLAPDSQLTMPGGEFIAEGMPPGLGGVLAWAAWRAERPVQAITVAERQPYSYMDAVTLTIGGEQFAVFVTIEGRKLVKLFGAKSFAAL